MMYLIAFLLIIHGLANLAGFAAFTLQVNIGFSDDHWLFSKTITRQTLIGRLFGVLWFLSTLFLVAGGIGLIIGFPSWHMMSLVGLACSFLSIAPWWQVVVPGARIGAIFDVLMFLFLVLR